MSDQYLLSGVALLVLRSTIVLGCAALAMLFLRRRPAAERHLVWLLALVGVIVLPALIAVAPTWRVPVPALASPLATRVVATSSTIAAVAGAADGTRGSAASAAGRVASADVPVAAAAGVALSPVVSDAVVGPDVRPRSRLAAPSILFALWFAGVLLAGAGTLHSMLHVARTARRARPLRDAALSVRSQRLAAELGIRRPIELLEGDATTMPMTFGVRRAALLLPSTAAGWSAARQDAVLRHELAHIRRRDALAQLVADVACAIYWFNPLVWFAAARMRLEREHACDDIVLMAGARASDYAAELLAIARATRVNPTDARAAFALARPSRLRTRLAAVLDDRARSQRIGLDRLLPASALALAAVIAVASLTPAPVIAAPNDGVAGNATSSHPTDRSAGNMFAADATPATPGAFPAPDALGITQQDECWTDRFQGTGTVTARDVSGSSYRVVQRAADGLELCMRTSDTGTTGTRTASSEVRLDLLPVGGRIELAARSADGSQSMHIVREPGGLVHSWFVNGAERAFDDTARAWRDAMLDVLNGYGRISGLRGEAASLRGQMASVRGHEASLRGQIASARGREASMRGQIASERGREASLRGEVASIRGREASLRGQIASARAQRADNADARVAAAERQLAEYDADARVRAVEARIREHRLGAREQAIEADIATLDTERRVREIEARIAQLDVPGELRTIEGRLDALDVDARVRELEAAVEPQLAELQRIIRRIR